MAATGRQNERTPDFSLGEGSNVDPMVGVAGYDFPIWYGVCAPARTPPAVVDKPAKNFSAALAAPDVRDRLATTAPSR